MPKLDKTFLESLSIIDKINEETKKIDRIIQPNNEAPNGYSRNKLLLSFIKAEIGDINRFANHEKLVSYAGLCLLDNPKEIRGRITKQGSKLLRWILIQCANEAVRNDEYLRKLLSENKKERT